MKSRLLILPLLVLMLSGSTLKAATIRLSIDGGVSKQVGQLFNDYNWGFNLGGNAFFFIGNNVLYGIRVAYNRWTPQSEEFKESVTNLINGKVSGSSFTWEFLPSLRLTTDFPVGLNVFAQGGAGFYVINTQTTLTGTNSVTDTLIHKSFGVGTSGRFGVQMGGGLSFGSPTFVSIDVLSLYNFVFIGPSNILKYFTINVGVGIAL